MASMANSLTIQVPKDYGYVILTATGSFVLGFWHMMRVGAFRRAAGVPYPIPYALHNVTPENKYVDTKSPKATEEYLFNCVQRSHGQFIEHYGMFMPMLLIAGLEYPRASSAMGVFWMISRFLFGVGYTMPNKPKGTGRYYGGAYLLVEFAYVFMCAKIGWDMIKI